MGIPETVVFFHGAAEQHLIIRPFVPRIRREGKDSFRIELGMHLSEFLGHLGCLIPIPCLLPPAKLKFCCDGVYIWSVASPSYQQTSDARRVKRFNFPLVLLQVSFRFLSVGSDDHTVMRDES